MMLTKKLKDYDKKFDLIAVLAIALFFLFAIFMPSVKAFFVLAFILFGFLVFFYSFPKAIIYTAFPLSYIGVAQIHSILVVPAKAIVSHQYWEGRHLIFGISPYLIISAIALLMIPFWKKYFKDNLKLKNYEKTIIILFGLGFLSSIYGSLISSLSMFSVFSQLTSIVWVWYFSRTLFNSSKKIQQKIIVSLFLIISMLIAYESLIVLKQTISQSPMGLLIETTKFTPSFGLGSDEGGGGFRPFGLQSHPNGLANNQLILGFCTWILYCYLNITNKKEQKKITNILIFNLILVNINIVLSLSRAAFIAVFLVAFIFFIRHRNKFLNIVKKLKNKFEKIPLTKKLIFSLVMFMLIFKLTTRLMNSLYSFSEFGGVNTRGTQYTEAFLVFIKSPIFGIGDSMFIPTSFQLFPKGVMSYFPENVHNGFFLFIVERGILGLVTYLCFLFLLYKRIQNSHINKEIKSVIYSGLIAGFTMMIFHPERNLLSNFVLLVVALVTLNYEKKYSIKN